MVLGPQLLAELDESRDGTFPAPHCALAAPRTPQAMSWSMHFHPLAMRHASLSSQDC